MLKDLSHGNLVSYHGLDVSHEAEIITLHLIMENVGGGSLRTKIQQFSPLTLEVSSVPCICTATDGLV